MKTNTAHETTRRTFLQTCAAGLGAAGLNIAFPSQGDPAIPASSPAPILRLEADPKRALVPVLSWDTEGGERFHSNLLRKGTGVGLRVRTDGQWREGADLPAAAQPSGDGARYRLQVTSQSTLEWNISVASDSFGMTLSAAGSGSLPPKSVEMVFPFDPMVTPTTVLPSGWRDDGSFELPILISAPDFGQMLLRITPPSEIRGRLEGSRDNHTVDLVLELPQLDATHKYTFSFTPVTLAPPPGLQDEAMWRLARRGWFNAFQPSARWGDQNRAFSAPPGILANNVISDPCSMSLIFYADHMLWTPVVAEGISVAELVRHAIEFWLEQRTHMTGEVVGYWDYVNFLDANAGPVICAWDYVEATGNLTWLEKTIRRLEFVADFHARRDQDFDGLVEATQSGNANTLIEPDRSSNWFDAVNYGHKDAYANAVIYRSWRCLADLESKLHREEQRARYTKLAERLKAAYARSLYNPETGWIACWRSQDGKLHDYASPVTNGLAIEYGLVDLKEGRKIVEKIWAKMEAAGFHRFELGIPPTLEPILRADYLQPEGLGSPHREDGTDTFQQYENGGISAGHSLHFLVASYLVGEGEKADNALRAILGRQQAGGFQNGEQNAGYKGIDWTTWDGKPCGYEGYLADVYYFLLTVLLREPSLRARFYRPLSSAGSVSF
jgi:hypothetical protein